MRKLKEFTVGITRIIQTAPYETVKIDMSETFSVDPDDDQEVQRKRALKKLIVAMEEATERERRRYSKKK